MQWYHYLSGLGAGLFLGNFVPHFVKGICGDPFPTPFAKPPGKGLSSPLVNVLWGLLNLAIGYILFRVGRVSVDNCASILICFIGVACISIMCAVNFAHKDKI